MFIHLINVTTLKDGYLSQGIIDFTEMEPFVKEHGGKQIFCDHKR